MNNDKTERLLAEIGGLLAEDEEYPLEGTLLYAVLDRNMVAPSIYKPVGNKILYRSPDLGRLGDALLDLWEAQEANDQWSEIEYIVRDGRFEVTFNYFALNEPDVDWMERRNEVVRRYFGDKPIVYPPWTFEEDGLDFEL